MSLLVRRETAIPAERGAAQRAVFTELHVDWAQLANASECIDELHELHLSCARRPGLDERCSYEDAVAAVGIVGAADHLRWQMERAEDDADYAESVCGPCAGSGEGGYDGSTCSACRGGGGA